MKQRRQKRRGMRWLRWRVKRLARRVFEVALDRATGMETFAYVSHEALEFDETNGKAYEPSGWATLLTLRRVFRELSITDRDVFIDFGSGKGRAIYWAARYPFRRVIGVELSERLNQIARRNIDKNRERFACKDVTLVTSDALKFDIPNDLTVAYLYNPFQGAIFTGLLDRLCASVRGTPRPFHLVYVNPVMHEQVLSRGFRVTSRGNTFYVYEYAPSLTV